MIYTHVFGDQELYPSLEEKAAALGFFLGERRTSEGRAALDCGARLGTTDRSTTISGTAFDP